MSKRQTIFIATSGEYSDYHIVGVFATRELAEAAQAGESIEEFDVFDHIPRKALCYYYNGMVLKNGEVLQSSLHSSETSEMSDIAFGKAIAKAETVLLPDGRRYRVNVWGYSKSRVVKAFQDRLARLQAELAGVA